MNNEPKLLVNVLICPDGTVLQSRHQHDYQRHETEDGRYYSVDGGLEYSRISAFDSDFKQILLNEESPHEDVREWFDWGRTLNKDGKFLPEPQRIKLKDISDNHLISLLAYTTEGYPKLINDLFYREYHYRLDNNIKVEDYE